MDGFFLKDVKRSFLNLGFFIGTAVVAVLLLAAVVTGAPLNRTRSSYYILTNVFAASGFGPFAAVFPVLAYGTSFCEEYQSGYYRMIFARMSPVRFGKIRIFTVALSGGVMLAVPIALSCAAAYIFGVPGVPQASDQGLLDGNIMFTYITKYGDWYVAVGKTVLGFLFGCVWALVGFAFAVWTANRYVALIAPFVLYESLWIALDKMPYLNPIRLLRGEDVGSYPLAAGMECIYLIVVSAVILAGLMRRYRNG
ncbi:MAG: hypothetical protein HFH06_04040 [Lachnospiraceae bacterium]|nr:hypothetical protein [Lachnospiraceae bacterium]